MAGGSILPSFARILYAIGDFYISVVDKFCELMRVPLREERKRVEQWRDKECRRVQAYWKEEQHFEQKLIEETEKVEQWWKDTSSGRCSGACSGPPCEPPFGSSSFSMALPSPARASGWHPPSLPSASCSGSSVAVKRRAPPSKGYYAVANGRIPGVYDSWKDADEQVTGYRFASFCGRFRTWAEAQEWRVRKTQALRVEGVVCEESVHV